MAGDLRVTLNFEKAPECEKFAKEAKRIAEKWYPKIHKLLYVQNHHLVPEKDITMFFEPMEGVAHAVGNEIHVSASWVKNHPDDIGLVVHELTHIVQQYKGYTDFWLTEGIADYVRYFHYEPEKQKWLLGQESSYKQGYGIAAGFLNWLEKKYERKAVIITLNTACHDGGYQSDSLEKLVGENTDALWQHYLKDTLKK